MEERVYNELIMGRTQRLFLIGLLVMVLPHLGFTGMVENIIYFSCGFLILISAYSLHLQKKGPVVAEAVKKTRAASAKAAPVRTRAIKKIPSPYLPPLVKETPPVETNGFVFIKRTENEPHA